MAEKASRKGETPQGNADVVSDGNLIYIDYVARTKDDGRIFDLTLEEVAKKEGLFKENDRYEPMLVAIGWKWLLPALEEQLVGMKVGESKTVEIPPEKGAGIRDPKKLKLIPRAKILKSGVRPAKGEQVKVGNEQGTITADLGRQLRVDFNPPLAGKTLVFDVTVKEMVRDPNQKIMAVIKRRIPGIPNDKYTVSASKETITIEMPKETRYLEGVQYAEIGVAADVLKLNPDAKQVKFIVTYERPKENTTGQTPS
ncbi:MAG: peptidylprolyl isomerase [Candidatus Thorarchaeota archaeon]|nr:MAG: peptidylprolyl isomerase [Candidatus Thorarchaeota archaeon]